MKVLVERKPFEGWTMEVICDGRRWEQEGKIPCGSSLEINADDLKKRAWFRYPEITGLDYGFVCPVCGCFTPVDETELGKFLKEQAKEYK